MSAHNPTRSIIRRTLGALAVAMTVAGSATVSTTGCGSTTDSGKGHYAEPCSTIQCGGTCSTDADCPAGAFCGTAGTCTAVCAIGGKPCTGGLVCTKTGRCASGGGIIGGGVMDGALTDATSCQIDAFAGEKIPTDIYIMNDKSASMTCSIPTGGDRWAAMKTALTTFISDPAAAGLGVGIQYFGLGPNGDSCNVADYTPAAVEIAALPGNQTPLIDSLNAQNPNSYTPTPAAMQGAVAHAQAWKTAHPTHFVAIVLATDGEPNRCGNSADRIGDVAATAAAAFNASPSIPTYVIGIVGGAGACNLDPAPPNAADLNRVAAAGGTNTAFIVDAATGDTAQQFLDAMNAIRGATQIPCQYVIPATTQSGQTIDATRVRVQITPQGGAAYDLREVADETVCASGGGWYFDPQDARKVILCPSTCGDVTANQPQVNFILGCSETSVVH